MYRTAVCTLIALSTLVLGACYADDGRHAEGDFGDGGDPAPPADNKKNQLDPDEQDVCEMDEDVRLFLSPDDSNSMSSPVQARESVLVNGSVSGVPIRAWEFLNYYSFDYPVADPGEVTLRAELRDLGEGEYQLQIGVGSESIDRQQREPMNVTLVLDESGSMGGEPIDLLKATARAIAGELREGDIISMVSWDTSNNIRLQNHPVSGPDDPTVLDAIAGIEASGGTNLHGGLTTGYELAQQNFEPGRINRVVLISDGGANVGVTDADLIGDMAGGEDEEGIYMVGVGVGSRSTYNDELMDTVTDRGKGASIFIPSVDEADEMFGERFINSMAVAVRDVQVQLDLPPGFEIKRFSGEEYSDDPSEIEPQHLAPNDAMVFFQHIETCAPELIDADTELSVTARWQDPITFQERELSVTRTFGELLDDNSPQLEKGAAILAYAEALENKEALVHAFAELERAEAALPGDEDLAEIRKVLEAL